MKEKKQGREAEALVKVLLDSGVLKPEQGKRLRELLEAGKENEAAKMLEKILDGKNGPAQT